jgi:8-oxo-dGTP pyrophosphatase MutT (NUDIX family)
MADERDWLLAKLKTYQERYESDAFAQEESNKIKSFVEQNEYCFLRSNADGHITGSAWIVNESLDSCLLIHHRKLGVWLQLGGHADGESNILNVAVREAEEESGLIDFKVLSEEIFDVDVHAIPARLGEPAHFHYDVRFLLQASSGLPLYRSERESLELAWVPLEAIQREERYGAVKRIAEKNIHEFLMKC